MEKKSERLEVRLGYEEKQTFTEACENQGDTPSGAVRRFINGYVRRSDADVISSAWRGATRRRFVKPTIALATIAVLTLGGFWMFGTKVTLDSNAIFTERDRNADGYLDYSEHAVPPKSADEPSGFVRVLDIDGDGLIARDEFVARGRMAYILSGPKSDRLRFNQPLEGTGITVVKFDITGERSVTGTYSFNESLKKLDRLVLFHQDGEISVVEGPLDATRGGEFVAN